MPVMFTVCMQFYLRPKVASSWILFWTDNGDSTNKDTWCTIAVNSKHFVWSVTNDNIYLDMYCNIKIKTLFVIIISIINMLIPPFIVILLLISEPSCSKSTKHPIICYNWPPICESLNRSWVGMHWFDSSILLPDLWKDQSNLVTKSAKSCD